MQAVTGAPDKINKQTEVKNPVGDDNNFKVLGFCGTVAGWSAPICKNVCDWLGKNKDCDITMPLSLKTMEVNEVNNVTGKGSFNIRNWDVLNGPFDKPRNFANIWHIKWNQIKSLKFETVQIHFLSDVFGLLSFRNLLS